MRQSWLLFVVFILFLMALSVVVPSGKAIWGKNWPEANRGLDVDGGTRIVLRAKIEELKPAEMKNWPEQWKEIPNILQRRLSGGTGVREANVFPKGTPQDAQFVVELPGITNRDDVIDLLKTTARLEFWYAKNVKSEQDPNRRYQSKQTEGPDGGEEFDFQDTADPEGKIVLKSGSVEFKKMIHDPDAGWDIILDGSMLKTAKATPIGTTYEVQLEFNSTGADKLKEFSEQVSGRGEYLAILLDGRVISFPRMNAVITNGSAVIEGGNMTGKTAMRLAGLLQAGALPVDLEQISMYSVQPTIGAHALDAILRAGAVGFTVISLFMILYYALPGLLAVIALCVYSIFCYAVFKMMGVTFSIAGIAGFLLSIGMAVDANVLIFERMKEELRANKTLLSSIDAGFKRAFSAIFDSNLCTIITCVILYNLGTGPVQGFAATLGIGVAISLFTAVTLTRMILYLLVGSGVDNPKLFHLGRQWFGHDNLQIVKRMGLYFAISAAVMVPGLIFFFSSGLKPNIEFQGGTEIMYHVNGEVKQSMAQIQSLLAGAGFTGGSVQLTSAGKAGQEVIVRLKEFKDYPTLKGLSDFESRVKVAEALKPIGIDATVAAGTTKIASEESFSTVGNVITAETIQNATKAVILSIVFILAYLSFRFAIEGGWSGLKFGIAALSATLHDIVVVMGVAAIFGYLWNWEISSLFMTAVLTIIGFSVHDTIVIFDRIRENLRHKKKGETFDDLVDRSITQSYARSINTSFTVLIMVGSMLVLGSVMQDLKHFNAIMLVGIISGTYSSIYNASPVLVLIERWTHKRGGQTLEAAVKERETKRVVIPDPATGEGRTFSQTGRDGDVQATDNGDSGKTPPSDRPKSKKPKRRF